MKKLPPRPSRGDDGGRPNHRPNSPEKSGLQSGVSDIVDAVTHFKWEQLLFTLQSFTFRPAASLHAYVNKDQLFFQKPFAFFAVSIIWYSNIIRYILIPQHWYFGLSDKLEPFQLFFILFGLSFISWWICGVRRFTLFKVFSIYAYVYGTIFFLNPFFAFAIANTGLLPYLENLPDNVVVFITDLPTVLFIYGTFWKFFQLQQLEMWRFLLTSFMGLLYYVAYFCFC